MAQKIRKQRISKAEFRRLGGLKNPALFREQKKGGAWKFYVSLDHHVAPDSFEAMEA